MNTRIKELLVVALLGLAIPALLLGGYQKDGKQQNIMQQNETKPPVQTPENNDMVFIAVLHTVNGEISKIPLEEYVLSVVLKEMPAQFEPEALKAQAVVARTYALRRMEMGSKHFGAAVCTDSSCCQGYCNKENYLSSGGNSSDFEKVKSAVNATSGKVLTYNGSLAEATYFSCSGGKTEDAQSVWGSEVPYLSSVDSPGEESAAHYTDTITMSTEEFQKKLGVQLDGYPSSWVGAVSYTNGGGVENIHLAGNEYQGTWIRQKLGLRSTAFALRVVGNTVTITTKGFGHRVGMSQYGADAMALKGATYQQILSHYYKGTELKTQEK